MNYISTEQLDKEINHPLVRNSKPCPIDKYINTNNWSNDEINKKRSKLEPQRPITTKAFIFENNFFTT